MPRNSISKPVAQATAHKSRNRCNAGFTIVELMIALSVLSILLILSTLVLMNLGKSYVKGSNQAAAQNAARNIVNDIANQIKLGGAEPDTSHMSSSSGYFCIGTTRYSYLVGRQVKSSPDLSAGVRQTRHALWRDTMGSGICPQPIDSLNLQANPPTADGVELIPGDMRLAKFSIVSAGGGSSGLYELNVSIAYGDNDLLCVHGAGLSGGSDCDSVKITTNPSGHMNNLINPGSRVVGCISGTGNQYCGVSNLSVTVARRLSNE